MNKEISEIMGRWDHAKSRRLNHEKIWEEIQTLMNPFRGDILTKRAAGTKRITGIFHSGTMVAAENFVNFLKGNIIPSNDEWLRLGRIDNESTISEDQRLYRASRGLLSDFSRSNFYAQMGTALRDFSLLGNSCVYVEEEAPQPSIGDGNTFGGFFFEAVPIHRVWWLTGRGNKIIMVFREFDIPALDAYREFKGNPGEKVLQMMSRGEHMTPVKYLHCVYKNEDGIPGGLVPAENKPWLSTWISVAGKPEVVRRGGYNTLPYIISRWSIVDGEEYGRGRGNLARPTAKGRNELKRQILIAAGRDMNPTLLMEHENVLQLEAGPNNVAVVRRDARTGTRWPLEYLNSGSDYGAADKIARDDDKEISDAFFGDALSDPDTQPRSAEESSQRKQRALQKLTAPADMVDSEMLGPTVAACVEIKRNAGAMPDYETVVREGRGVQVAFVSQFFTAQQEAAGASEDRFVLETANLAGLIPQAADTVNWDRYLKRRGKRGNVSPEILNTEEEIQAIRQARAQAEAQARLQEAAKTIAEVESKAPGTTQRLAETAAQARQL